MGTSGASKGLGGGTALIPSWLDEDPGEPLPCGEDPTPGTEQDGATGEGKPSGEPASPAPAVLPQLPPPALPARFRGGRRNFTAFARSRGNDYRALRRGIRDAVRSGSGGARNAVRRMGASRAVAGAALGVFRGFQRDGVQTTLRRLNLDSLVGRPPTEIFLGLTDVICPDGGAIDEGIARDAWLETVAELEALDATESSTLSDTQIREVFLAFVSHSIEARVFQDIGVNGFKVAPDLAAIERFEAELRSYIRFSVRDSFSSSVTSLEALSDRQIRAVVDRTYTEAWDLLVMWGDATR